MAEKKSSAPRALLAALNSRPPPACRSEQIDFAKAGIPEYAGKFAVLIHDLLSPAECKALLQAAEQTSAGEWEGAMVNVGMGQQKIMTDIRLCGRIIWDTPEVVDALLTRIRPHLPSDIVTLNNAAGITGAGPVKRKETYQMTRLNERLRFLKYTSGMYFREHQDGSYITPDGSEISFMTAHIYLNGQDDGEVVQDSNTEDSQKPLKGGATRFFGYRDAVFDVSPATGACLIFQHRALHHSGEEVEQGTKYTIRTDIMYRKEGE